MPDNSGSPSNWNDAESKKTAVLFKLRVKVKVVIQAAGLNCIILLFIFRNTSQLQIEQSNTKK